jgi:SAM-dependent methyltransferase
MNDTYTQEWFSHFMRNISPEQTAHEARFLCRHLPRPRFTPLVDLCCGTGRHARILAEQGYQVTGIDRDLAAIDEARRSAPATLRLITHDMRLLADLGLRADGVLLLWQSFGHFDDATNASIVEAIAAMLPDGGRLILDIYHREFFARHQGARRFDHHGTTITETKYLQGNRLSVELKYEGSSTVDRFDWRLFTPDEIIALAASHGFQPALQCTGYDEGESPTPDAPRMQFVFEKREQADLPE